MGPFRSQHVAPVSPYLLSRQIRIGNVSAFSCQKTGVESCDRSRSSLSSCSNSSIRFCSPRPRPPTQAAHQLPKTACPESSCCCFSLPVGFFGFIPTLAIYASKGSSSSSFPISTSARDSPTGSMSSPIGATSRFRVFVGLTSALLCHHRFPTADSSSRNNARHRSHGWFLQTSLLDSGRN